MGKPSWVWERCVAGEGGGACEQCAKKKANLAALESERAVVVEAGAGGGGAGALITAKEGVEMAELILACRDLYVDIAKDKNNKE